MTGSDARAAARRRVHHFDFKFFVGYLGFRHGACEEIRFSGRVKVYYRQMGLIKYGREWPDEATEFNIELAAFKMGLDYDEGGLGKEQHFRNIVDAMWGPHNERKKFVWHPWSERMLWAACNFKTLAVAGCGSSGKTDFFAVWAIINFLCDPINTMVLVTSTSLKESRKRIWGSIREYWLSIPGLPGKLVDSHGLIRLDDGSGDSAYSEKSGTPGNPGEMSIFPP